MCFFSSLLLTGVHDKTNRHPYIKFRHPNDTLKKKKQEKSWKKNTPFVSSSRTPTYPPITNSFRSMAFSRVSFGNFVLRPCLHDHSSLGGNISTIILDLPTPLKKNAHGPGPTFSLRGKAPRRRRLNSARDHDPETPGRLLNR